MPTYFTKILYSSARNPNNRAFTLMEVLLVVAGIAILAGIVIVAINPTKQLGDTRNTQRKADVATILNATYQYMIDGNALPASVTTTPTEICRTGGTCTGLIDLSPLTTNEKYLTAIPLEPQKTNVNGAGYRMLRTSSGRVTVSAQFAEQGASISATK